ncbi:MAG TPA: prepilin-type N-terminal cleavage/methylation domain-containing protein [Planctomycetota bacterium]|jgi:prepilin-type N-terminal cleavage/methylation domain-containing protein|nr:prepilin-type N-terminal cleavage/methylation domain-containing protein [Planctomycetota bacterium]
MKNRRNKGFTLIEIMISVAVLAILVIGIYSALSATQNLYVAGVTRQTIQDRVRKALNDIALELRQANSGAAVPLTFGTAGTAGDQSVTFQMCTGFAAGAATYGTAITFTTINGDGETDNGVDDNGNHMIDERKLVRIQGTRTILIADFVKEGSLRFTRSPAVGAVQSIRVDLTLQGVDDKGKVLEASGTVTVDLRNQ